MSEALFLVQEQPKRPAIKTLVPAQVQATGKPVALQVLGADFTPGAVVLVNGQAQRTRVVSASSLEALLEARDTTKPGQLLIAVLNRDTGLRTEKDVILKVVSPTLK